MTLAYPFLQPAFFDALEQSGGACAASGWQPVHLQQDDSWMPLYLKSHNRGEYVFDHGWAQAYAEHGLRYFPRLVTAVPFSPLTGPRWRGNPDPGWIGEQVRELAGQHGASSWHLLFPDQPTLAALQSSPLSLARREACHFRWFNRGYREFEDFLAGLTSRRRKAIRRERKQIQDSSVRVEQAIGEQIPADWWSAFYQCYADTYFKRGQRPYLGEEFFQRLRHSSLLNQLMLVMALVDEKPIAAAFYLFDQHTLYGRYWGSLLDIGGLHFELCYYRGIEFCIE
ncbi:MAG: GNAT family N-acetyltransferase, partial [Alcanivoracaceae bacterium]|nr:GNAT family N-acetyltransferase [Alcanivoracaceae bacterium]